MVYTPVARQAIRDALAHIRDLHRRLKPLNEQEWRTHERRELATRDLLSNLLRTNEHPTLKTLLEVADICSLTLEGAHRLFGYNLEKIRDFDLRLNGGHTHIKRSHQRLSAGEVHSSLCMRDTCERERRKRWPNNAEDTRKLKGEGKLPQSSAGSD